MAARRVVVELTVGQIRAINGALAYVTSGSPEDGGMQTEGQLQTAVRARVAVQDAMESAGVTP